MSTTGTPFAIFGSEADGVTHCIALDDSEPGL